MGHQQEHPPALGQGPIQVFPAGPFQTVGQPFRPELLQVEKVNGVPVVPLPVLPDKPLQGPVVVAGEYPSEVLDQEGAPPVRGAPERCEKPDQPLGVGGEVNRRSQRGVVEGERQTAYLNPPGPGSP